MAYHRVAAPEHDPLLLAVRPAHFAQHLEVLARVAVPTPLSALARAVHEGRIERGAAVITFDDGYRDNLTEARPLLERAEVPATVFVTTGVSGAAFWWDELERLILLPTSLPDALRIEAGGTLREWTLDSTQSKVEGGNGWNVLEPAQSQRQRLYLELHALLRRLPSIPRNETLTELARWSTSAPPADIEARCLTETEIAELAADGLVSIGAHTATHPVLATLSAEDQRDEITRSRSSLAKLLDRPPSSFAYPYGGIADYSGETVKILRETAFDCACTTTPGAVERRSDPFELPRFLVRDWDGDEFERRLRSLFHA